MRFTRKAHHDVVRRHRPSAAGVQLVGGDWLARKLPKILAIVEYLRHVHVVGAVLERLNLEQVLGVADVLLKIGRHRGERLDSEGKMRR